MRNNPDVHDPHPCHTDSSLPVYTCGIMESAYDQFTEGENVCGGAVLQVVLYNVLALPESQ